MAIGEDILANSI